MPILNTKIRTVIDHLRRNLPPEMVALIEQGAGEISALDIVERALRVGDPAPDFKLPAYGGGERALADYLKHGPVVLTFYRGVWCPYCNLQLKEYNDRLAEITDLGATLVAVTPEKPGALDALAAAGVPSEVTAGAVTSVDFDVLHDAGSALARQYGLVFELPMAHLDLLGQLGVQIDVLTGDSSFAFADPATYIIAPDGRIHWAFVPNNYRKRAEVDAITGALRALIHTNAS